MIQIDLRLAGIPYKTADGIADFHAAGRHTYITELLRNGTSIPEARELARHSDVHMTMKYTHIGIEDQARAVSQLRVPGDLVVSSIQHSRQQLCRPRGQGGASGVTIGQTKCHEYGTQKVPQEKDLGTESDEVAPRGASSHNDSKSGGHGSRTRNRQSRHLISNQTPNQFGYPPCAKIQHNDQSHRIPCLSDCLLDPPTLRKVVSCLTFRVKPCLRKRPGLLKPGFLWYLPEFGKIRAVLFPNM
jgi:hypothetical protein